MATAKFLSKFSLYIVMWLAEVDVYKSKSREFGELGQQ